MTRLAAALAAEKSPLPESGVTPHALHGADRHWPQTNCYVDLWIELLHRRGLDPAAALGFTVGQAFEGDQFTFFKYPAEDLEAVYGLAVQELAIFDRLEGHCLQQVARDNIVLVEVDGWFLPDTRGLTYRAEHSKTTIGVEALDPERRHLTYFHNAGLYTLEGEDYDGIFPPGHDEDGTSDALFPYAEFVCRRGEALHGPALVQASLARFAVQRQRRPTHNIVATYRDAFPAHMDRLMGRPQAFFHKYAFNTLRQLGANFEMLASYAAWLGQHGCDGLAPAAEPALRIAQEAKVLQFRLARIAARHRFDPCTETFDVLQRAYEEVMAAVDRCPL